MLPRRKRTSWPQRAYRPSAIIRPVEHTSASWLQQKINVTTSHTYRARRDADPDLRAAGAQAAPETRWRGQSWRALPVPGSPRVRLVDARGRSPRPPPGAARPPSLAPAPALCAPRRTGTQEGGGNAVLAPARRNCSSAMREVAPAAHAGRAAVLRLDQERDRRQHELSTEAETIAGGSRGGGCCGGEERQARVRAGAGEETGGVDSCFDLDRRRRT